MFYRLCLALALIASACSQQPKPLETKVAEKSIVPDTPAGRMFKAWLDAFNSGDRAIVEAYCRKYEPSKSVDDEMQFRGMTGERRKPARDAAPAALVAAAAIRIVGPRTERLPLEIAGRRGRLGERARSALHRQWNTGGQNERRPEQCSRVEQTNSHDSTLSGDKARDHNGSESTPGPEQIEPI